MTTYKLTNNHEGVLTWVDRYDGICIPIAPDNTDYQQFKKDIQNGTELLDAEGNPITGDALKTFLATLP